MVNILSSAGLHNSELLQLATAAQDQLQMLTFNGI